MATIPEQMDPQQFAEHVFDRLAGLNAVVVEQTLLIQMLFQAIGKTTSRQRATLEMLLLARISDPTLDPVAMMLDQAALAALNGDTLPEPAQSAPPRIQ